MGQKLAADEMSGFMPLAYLSSFYRPRIEIPIWFYLQRCRAFSLDQVDKMVCNEPAQRITAPAAAEAAWYWLVHPTAWLFGWIERNWLVVTGT